MTPLTPLPVQYTQPQSQHLTSLQILKALVLTILAAFPHPALEVNQTFLVPPILLILAPLVRILAVLILLPLFLMILEVLDHLLEILALPVPSLMEILEAQSQDQQLVLTSEETYKKDLDFLEAPIKVALAFLAVLLKEDPVLEMQPLFLVESISAKPNALLMVDCV